MELKEEWTAYLPVRAFFFGTLNLDLGGYSFTRQLARSEKMSGLLAYLMIYSGRSVSVRELLEAVWGDAENNNPESALKMQIYRLRTYLKELGVPFYKECIIAERGGYRWNMDIPCIVDVVEFERFFQEASVQTRSNEERIVLLQQALTMYQGDFLPICAAQSWTLPLTSYYRLRYQKVVTMLVELLQENGQHAQMVDVCRRAVLIEPLEEELHYALMRALVEHGRDKEACNHYCYMEKLFLDKLGAPPSEHIRIYYQELSRTEKRTAADLNSITRDLQETSVTEGVYICDYNLFRQIYRLQSRIAMREGVTMSVVLLTVTASNGDPLSAEDQGLAMKNLLTLAQSCLRNTDMIAPYSPAQFVLMLPSIMRSHAETAIARLCVLYKSIYPNGQAAVHYLIDAVEPTQSALTML